MRDRSWPLLPATTHVILWWRVGALRLTVDSLDSRLFFVSSPCAACCGVCSGSHASSARSSSASLWRSMWTDLARFFLVRPVARGGLCVCGRRGVCGCVHAHLSQRVCFLGQAGRAWCVKEGEGRLASECACVCVEGGLPRGGPTGQCRWRTSHHKRPELSHVSNNKHQTISSGGACPAIILNQHNRVHQ